MGTPGLFFLLIFAGIGIRYISYNCNISLLRTERWKTFLSNSSMLHPQAIYNEVYFSFAVQHVLVNIAFTVTGIICLVDPDRVSSVFVQALFLHQFLFELSLFVRDWKYFDPKFLKLYWIHHFVTIFVGIAWISLGIFKHLSGVGGFIVLTFMGSVITSSVSFFLNMFMEPGRPFYMAEITLIILQRIWRWIIIIYGIYIWRVVKPPEVEGQTVRILIVLVSGVIMEVLDCIFHTKAAMSMWNMYRECNNNNQDEGSKGEESFPTVEVDSKCTLDKEDTVFSIARGICDLGGAVELADDFLQMDEENTSISTKNDHDLNTAFEKAVQIVNSPVSTNWSLTGDQKLTLYTWYKQATIGPCNLNRPNGFGFNERCKLKAWKQAGSASKQVSMQRYIETVQIFHKDDIFEDPECQT